jgi:hypothetical protein
MEETSMHSKLIVALVVGLCVFALTMPVQAQSWTQDDIPWLAETDIPTGLTPAGYANYTVATDSFQIGAGGADIWGTADECHYLYLQVSGDFWMQATVEHDDDNVNDWEKAGVDVRATLEQGSPHAMCIICQACRDSEPHIVAQERVDADGDSQRFDGRPDGTDPAVNSRFPNTGPAIVRVERVGQTIYVGADNLEGINQLPQWYGADRPNIPDTCYVGLIMTSHSSGNLAEATISNVTTSVSAGPPPAPTNFQAVFSQGATTLTWDDVGGDGYSIERGTTTTAFTEIGTSISPQYVDSGPTGGFAGGTDYYYRVRGFVGAEYGDYSEVRMITTPTGSLRAKDWPKYD